MYGLIQSQADHTMFYKHSREGKVAILIVYMDDIIITRDDCDEIDKLKRDWSRSLGSKTWET